MAPDEELSDEQLVLGDLLNHVLDKGVVISGTVTVSIAGIDLLLVDLRLLLSSVQTMMARSTRGGARSVHTLDNADVPLLPPDSR
ncbi:MAG TPA: gas vesicle protein GvpJ [Gemmatimonadaceae bacterium]|nr:gas vesicle protein GvpJ [Gemmatimonadaceae bacterium]